MFDDFVTTFFTSTLVWNLIPDESWAHWFICQGMHGNKRRMRSRERPRKRAPPRKTCRHRTANCKKLGSKSVEDWEVSIFDLNRGDFFKWTINIYIYIFNIIYIIYIYRYNTGTSCCLRWSYPPPPSRLIRWSKVSLQFLMWGWHQ